MLSHTNATFPNYFILFSSDLGLIDLHIHYFESHDPSSTIHFNCCVCWQEIRVRPTSRYRYILLHKAIEIDFISGAGRQEMVRKTFLKSYIQKKKNGYRRCLKMNDIYNVFFFFFCLLFYGISTFIGYLMSDLVYIHDLYSNSCEMDF